MIPPNKLPFEIMKVTLEEPDTTGKRDAVVCFKDSQAVKEIFSKIPTAFCTYAVEIKPSIPSVSIISYFSNLQVQKKILFTIPLRKNMIQNKLCI